jgi:hypothetical protein
MRLSRTRDALAHRLAHLVRIVSPLAVSRHRPGGPKEGGLTMTETAGTASVHASIDKPNNNKTVWFARVNWSIAALPLSAPD